LRPKNAGPDQRVPVIARATSLSERQLSPGVTSTNRCAAGWPYVLLVVNQAGFGSNDPMN